MSKIARVKSLSKKLEKKAKTKKVTTKGDATSKGKTEAAIEKEIISFLLECEILHWPIKIKGDPMMTKKGIIFKKNKNKGFADLHCCFGGRAVYLEVKKCGGVCSEDQLDTQKRVRKAKGVYEFVTSVDEVRNIFLLIAEGKL